MSDKRKARRWSRRLTVRYGRNELAFPETTSDLSVGALYLVTHNEPPPLDTRLHLQLMLEGGRSLHFEGVVRRHQLGEPDESEVGGFGVRFMLPAELLPEMVPSPRDQGRHAVVYETENELREAF